MSWLVDTRKKTFPQKIAINKEYGVKNRLLQIFHPTLNVRKTPKNGKIELYKKTIYKGVFSWQL
jgi:hypothetical protein